MKPAQRQAMVVTVKELRTLAKELEQSEQQLAKQLKTASHEATTSRPNREQCSDV